MNKVILFLMFFAVIPSTGFAKSFQCTDPSGADNKVAELKESGEDGYSFRFGNTMDQLYLRSDSEAPVTFDDLEGLAKKAEVLKKMGTSFNVQIKSRQDCKFEKSNGERDWVCYIREPGKVGDLEYDSMAVFVYSQKITSAYSKTYRKYFVGWDITVKGQIYIVTVPFTQLKGKSLGCVFLEEDKFEQKSEKIRSQTKKNVTEKVDLSE